jgi:hypothetical protein
VKHLIPCVERAASLVSWRYDLAIARCDSIAASASFNPARASDKSSAGAHARSHHEADLPAFALEIDRRESGSRALRLAAAHFRPFMESEEVAARGCAAETRRSMFR